MWEGLFTLLGFSVAMAAASFLTGSLPLSVGLSQRSSRIISAIGTGLLIGTCLIIIIPEGVSTLYSSLPPPASDSLPDSPPDYLKIDDGLIERRDEHEHQHEHKDPHAWVGISLVIGFIMMYLIDQLPRHVAKLSLQRNRPQISLADLSAGLNHHNSSQNGQAGGQEQPADAVPRTSATTIGLVIHAVADGVALAASTFITETSLGFVIFLALMVHKAPAAFGLTSVLLKQGLSPREARAHLVVFSLAAPAGAFATWILVNLFAEGEIDHEDSIKFITGLLLLFSGGTFLYVAMHTMQDGGHEAHEDTMNDFENGQAFGNGRPAKSEGPTMGLRDTLFAVVGMLVPLVAQVGHAH